MRIFEQPQGERQISIAGGEASFLDVLEAARREAWVAENSNAAGNALDAAYARRIEAIKAATGQQLEHPLAAAEAEWRGSQLLLGGIGIGIGPQHDEIYRRHQAAFESKLYELAGTFPAASAAIAATTPIGNDAEAIARESDADLARLMASRPGWDKYIAAFAGGGFASLGDPVTIASLGLGGASVGRTIAGRILSTAASEALVNASTEAAMQPFVQAWREKAGLDAGFDQALANVLMAGGFGALFGGSARGLGEAIGYFRARGAIDPQGIPAEVRGALDHAEAAAATPIATPAAETLVARADAVAKTPDLDLPPLPADEGQIGRLVLELAPKPESIGRTLPAIDAAAKVRELTQPTRAARSRDVADFIRTSGGIDPASPLAAELEARGITPATAKTLFSPEGRKALDNIPFNELPESLQSRLTPEAGYAREDDLIAALAEERAGGRAEADSVTAERQHYERQGVDFDAPDAPAQLARVMDAEARYAAADVDSIAAERQHYERQGVDFDAPDAPAQLARVMDAEARYAAADEGLSDESVSLPAGAGRRAHTEAAVREVLRLEPGLGAEHVREAVNLHLSGETIPEALEAVRARASNTISDGPLPPSMADGLPPDPPALEERFDDPASLDAEDADLAAELAALEELGFSGDVPWEVLGSIEDMTASIEATRFLESVVTACKV